MRTRAERRKKNFSEIIRKKKLARSIYRGEDFYKHDGQYSKGKIHCSCPMCSCKTNNRGRYGKSENYKHSEEQKIDSMNEQIKEFNENTTTIYRE